MEAVSYTHLDVYKRQSLTRVLDHAGRPWRAYTGRLSDAETLRAELEGVTTVIHLAGAEARGNRRLLQVVDAVSYTHLDVYKRQLSILVHS